MRVATLGVRGGEALSFSPNANGQMLATIGEDGVALQRFDASWAEEHICQIVNRSMTRKEWNDYALGRRYRETCT
jgi:hypothetical protein